ncbi:MAG: hypothetical protein GQ532_08555 [Methylomarinum sp.]|nr:hypothetical protein [Methylomarinum sp.]
MELNDFINLIKDNYQWVFSGIGVLLISFFIKNKTSSPNKVTQKNITAGGDVVGRDKNG